MFNHLAEEIKPQDGGLTRLNAVDLADAEFEPCPEALTEFRLEAGLPVWEFDIGPIKLEKRILLPHLQNTVYIKYRLLSAPAGVRLRLRLRPAFHFRPHEAPVSSGSLPRYIVTAVPQGFEIHDLLSPPLRMCVVAPRSSLVLEGGQVRHVQYRLERARGYESTGTLWNPGYFRVDLSTGEEAHSVIAGYHWFTDWGRDTMISLEGLTLVTGRHAEAGYLLRTFARYVRDGLIPNLFPEGENEGLYHTADATLWYFHALQRYLQVTGVKTTLVHLLPVLDDIIEHHFRGTRFGIRVDPADGLLTQGQEGYQLTWMDAKVGDWVVTPRRGKAVEINALWYNALRLMEQWRIEIGDAAGTALMAERANHAQESFNRRFWYADGDFLYDVVDGEHGDDPALRPNQILALSLDNPVLNPVR